MRYLEIRSEPSADTLISNHPLWLRVLELALPNGNPDLGDLYEQARFWWLEVDDSGLPLREIGFDSLGIPIVLGPVEGNYGFLLDACDDWSDETGDLEVDGQLFAETWDRLWPRFAALDAKNRA